MNPHGFVYAIERDGSEWYETDGVDAFIAELEAENALLRAADE